MKRLVPFSIFGLLIAGCSRGNFSSRAGNDRAAAYTYAINASVTTLDPGKVQDVDYSELLQNVFEGLVAYDANNRISPKLAEKWEVKDGGRTYVFTLRKGVKFHNGRPLTADDFKYSMERALSKPLASPVALTYLGDIVGVKEYVDGSAKEVSGIKVIDPQTLSVTIDKPRPYFLGNLTYPCSFAVAKEAAGPKEISTQAQVVGTGPFRLTRIAQDQEFDLEANKEYWGGAPAVATIRRPVVKDPSTRLNQYKGGELDTLTIDRRDVASVQSDPKLKAEMHYEPRPALYYFALNQNGYPPFRDARVRKAFAMGMDRAHLMKDVIVGQQEAKGLIPPGVLGYREGYTGLPTDLEGARKLLAEAGYPGGKGLPPLEIAFREGRPDARLACESTATALEHNLGIKVSPHPYEWATLLARRNKGQYQTMFLSWYADYLDPQNFLSLLLDSKSKQNHDGYSNPEFDRLCEAADVEQDEAKRLAMYHQAEDIVVGEAGRVPVYFQRDPVLVSSRIKGFRSNLFGQMPNTTLRVEK